ncbi:retinoic acid receptor responder protein 2 [Pelobates fuscus]|uniref:retinoic acid receptor responder protein 2 n=1 Tax=Pelobates fuscus TaxID=191477 RepID=UPI002FE4DE00
MTRFTGAPGMVCVLLSLSVYAEIPKNELTDRQTQAVNIVMEHFHKREHIQNAFNVFSITKATETEFSAGSFVHLQFTLKPTTCRKHQWKQPDCKITKDPRSFHCLACFKFQYGSHQVMSEVKDCVLQRHLSAERKQKWTESCSEVKRKDEPPGLILPGVYSFLKSGNQ